MIQPKDFWEQSGWWPKYRKTQTMFVITDRRGVEYGLAPTAEELIIFMAKCDLSSYTSPRLTTGEFFYSLDKN